MRLAITLTRECLRLTAATPLQRATSALFAVSVALSMAGHQPASTEEALVLCWAASATLYVALTSAAEMFGVAGHPDPLDDPN